MLGGLQDNQYNIKQKINKKAAEILFALFSVAFSFVIASKIAFFLQSREDTL